MCHDRAGDGGGGGDCCRLAVTRAYREMQASGAPDSHCLDAALTVYRWHHPEASPPKAEDIVSAWIGQVTLH